jgi:hypothetical protein
MIKLRLIQAGDQVEQVFCHCFIVSKGEVTGQRRRQPSDNEQGCQMVYFQTKNPSLGKF